MWNQHTCGIQSCHAEKNSRAICRSFVPSPRTIPPKISSRGQNFSHGRISGHLTSEPLHHVCNLQCVCVGPDWDARPVWKTRQEPVFTARPVMTDGIIGTIHVRLSNTVRYSILISGADLDLLASLRCKVRYVYVSLSLYVTLVESNYPTVPCGVRGTCI